VTEKPFFLPGSEKAIKLLTHLTANDEERPCQSDPELWFSKYDEDINQAKKYCRTICPIRNMCLEYAIESKELFGVWGGMTPVEREQIITGRKITRRQMTNRASYLRIKERRESGGA
jgi:hypothetical protein